MKQHLERSYRTTSNYNESTFKSQSSSFTFFSPSSLLNDDNCNALFPTSRDGQFSHPFRRMEVGGIKRSASGLTEGRGMLLAARSSFSLVMVCVGVRVGVRFRVVLGQGWG
jgi:hypothetical protein